MDLTVIIPTCGRCGKLASCVRGLSSQTISLDRFEVLVTVDGSEQGEERAVAGAARPGLDWRVLAGPKGGPGAARNRALPAARGTWLVLLNDDVVPEPDLLETHIRAQREAAADPRRVDGPARGAMVLGAAPWIVHQPDRVFDRLLRDTSTVFFYDQMHDADPERDWGYRHAWTLNLSLPTQALRDVGGFTEGLRRAVYEDLEMGWRLRERFGMPVLYRPGAKVRHDHRYEPLQLLRRDIVLGFEAVNLARLAPACARETFGRDMLGSAEVDYVRGYVEKEQTLLARNLEPFLQQVQLPGSILDAAPALLPAIYQHAVIIRRWLFRLGHVAAIDGTPIEAAFERFDRLAGAHAATRIAAA